MTLVICRSSVAIRFPSVTAPPVVRSYLETCGTLILAPFSLCCISNLFYICTWRNEWKRVNDGAEPGGVFSSQGVLSLPAILPPPDSAILTSHEHLLLYKCSSGHHLGKCDTKMAAGLRRLALFIILIAIMCVDCNHYKHIKPTQPHSANAKI